MLSESIVQHTSRIRPVSQLILSYISNYGGYLYRIERLKFNLNTPYHIIHIYIIFSLLLLYVVEFIMSVVGVVDCSGWSSMYLYNRKTFYVMQFSCATSPPLKYLVWQRETEREESEFKFNYQACPPVNSNRDAFTYLLILK